jgi:eukaryotic-like serine/threonine-protein kinase
MMDTFGTPIQTLAQRMAQGRIPVQDALRYSGLLAEALRKVHESGQVHGALTPACVALRSSGIELLNALGSAGEITPYTAPEVVQGRVPDSRSDIFSFGAVVYEMLTGRPAFKGETTEALAAAITGSAPPPSGSPAVDRLVGSCLAKDPASRLQRVQKLILELKLLAVAVRRSETPARREAGDAELRAHVEQLEANLTSRMGRVEQGMAGLIERLAGIERAIQGANERHDSHDQRAGRIEQNVEAAGARLAALDERFAETEAAQQRVAAIEQTWKAAGPRFDSFDQRLMHVEQAIKTVGEYMERLDHGIESVRQENDAIRANLGEELRRFEQALKLQASTVESARTAMAQTDDLVERVVEALESLQSVVLEHSDDRAVGVN